MPRILMVILVLLPWCSLPAGVSAGGFLPDMPSFGGSSCAPAHTANCSGAGKLGYLYSNRLVFERAAVGANPGGINFVRNEVPVQGLWVAASVAGTGPGRGFAACESGDGLCVSLGASWLFPNNKEASEIIEDGSRTWRPNIQWYTLEGSVISYVVQNFSLIGGFRYDSFSTKFADPARVSDFGSSLPTDEAELILTSYIPYVGAVTKWGAVEMGVIGLPWVGGRIESRETIGGAAVRYETVGNYRNGYFLETYAEFGGQLGMVHLSAFATYTVLHAVGDCDFHRNPIGGVGVTAPDSFGIDRQNWIVGGKALIGFNSPL
jgi:hypothetical protein